MAAGQGYPPQRAQSPSGVSFAGDKHVANVRGLMDQSSVLGALPPPGQSRQGSALSIHSFGSKPLYTISTHINKQ